MGYGRPQKKFDNNMRGVFFANERKEKDSDPDMKGQFEINGVGFWVSAWWNQHATKGDYLKFNIEEKVSDDRSPQQRNNDYNSGRGSQRGGAQGQGAPQYGRGGNMPERGRGRPQQQNQGYGGNPADDPNDDISF